MGAQVNGYYGSISVFLALVGPQGIQGIPGPPGASGFNRTIQSVNTNTNVANAAATDYVYICSGTITMTLPTAVGNINRYSFKNAGTGVITLLAIDGQTIDLLAEQTITNYLASNDLISDNANWFVI